MEEVEVTSAEQLWAWLDANHAQEKGVRLVTWKASWPEKYISRNEVLDALIAYGWIDGRRFKVDEARTAHLITPRQQQAWSASYKKRAEKLRSEGRMHKAGEAAIACAKAAGLWNFFDDVDALIVPDDLGQTLDLEKWEAMAPSYRRNVLRWIKLSKTPATRRKRIDAAVAATAKDEKLPQM